MRWEMTGTGIIGAQWPACSGPSTSTRGRPSSTPRRTPMPSRSASAGTNTWPSPFTATSRLLPSTPNLQLPAVCLTSKTGCLSGLLIIEAGIRRQDCLGGSDFIQSANGEWLHQSPSSGEWFHSGQRRSFGSAGCLRRLACGLCGL